MNLLLWLLMQLTVSFPGPGPKAVAVTFQTPVFVSEVSKNSTLTTYNGSSTSLGTRASRGGTNSCVDYGYCFFYAETSSLGQIGVVSFTYSSSPASTPSAADDGGNSYNCSITNGTATDSTAGRVAQVCVGTLTTATARIVRVTFGTSAVTNVQGKAALFNNLTGAVDIAGSAGGSASSATANAVSVTTTQNNDLVYQFVCRTGTPAVTSFTQGSGMTIGTTEIHDGCATQWEVATSSGSVTPSLTMASASTTNQIVVALKAASTTTGTAPSGFYLERFISYSTPPSTAGPYTTQFPSAGNLLVNTDSCATAQTITGVSGGSNTWAQVGAQTGSSGSPSVGEVVAQNAAADSAASLSVALTGTGDCTVTFYSFKGAPSGKVLTRTAIPGFSVSGTAVTLTTTYQPWSTSGLSILVGGEINNTAIALTGAATNYWDSATYGGENIDGPQPIDQNNMYGHAYVTATGSQTWGYTLTATGAGPGGTTSDLVNFLGTSGIGIVNFTSCQQSTTSSDLHCTIPSTTSGNLIAISVGAYNSTARTISKVCLNGNSTCSTGTQLAALTGSTTTGNSSQGVSAIWYVLSSPSAQTSFDVVTSNTTTSREAACYEVQKGNGGTWVTDGGNIVQNGTAGATSSGGSVTPTGSPNFGLAHITISSAVNNNPNTGNAWNYANTGTTFTTGDAATSILTSSTSAQTPVWGTNSGTFNASTGFFR